ncbi:MAG TPA: pyridoxal phosphate-dependent aminotransferase [Streptosporangiaceae bacterium]|nr:pyridoxal phosphate-dependent aminotransferase [Streptosporangiaceae bacterium]
MLQGLLHRDDEVLPARRLGMFELDEEAAELERRHEDVIRLTLGKSELPVHTEITQAMVAALADERRSGLVHPLGLPELRSAIAEYESRARAMPVDPASVVVSVGSSLIFRNLCSLLCRPSTGEAAGEILIPRPYDSLYLYSAALAGAKVRTYDIDPFTGVIDTGSLAAAIGGATRAVVICSPGNPLGNVLTAEDLERIDAEVDGRAVIISDEICRNMSFDGPVASLGSLAAPRSPVIVTSAFSKGFRMYARRVGYAVMPARYVRALSIVQDHTLLTTDPVAQFGALEALRHLDEIESLRALYKTRRDYAMEKLSAASAVRPIRPSGGFYLTADVSELLRPGESDRSLARVILAVTHVATVPGSDFGLPGTLRLSFSASQFEMAVDRLARYFADGRASPPGAVPHPATLV